MYNIKLPKAAECKHLSFNAYISKRGINHLCQQGIYLGEQWTDGNDNSVHVNLSYVFVKNKIG